MRKKPKGGSRRRGRNASNREYAARLVMQLRMRSVREERTPIANPFTGKVDGSFSSSFYNSAGELVGSGVAVPYKRAKQP